MKHFLLSAISAVFLVCAPAKAHEFWIAPERHQVEPGAPIVAALRNGQQFEGIAIPYLPADYARFDIGFGGQIVPVTGRLGDNPALNFIPGAGEGLAVVVLETVPRSVTYQRPGQFAEFVAHKDLRGTMEEHARRGLPETGFSETYVRCVKALVAVGEGAGSDVVAGLETEIVAEANPYTDDLSGGLPLRVLYQGAPRAAAQVELFARAPDGTVTITLHRTDAEGRVRVPVAPGHAYFADAVVLRSTGTDDPATGPAWHSLWAGLSFAVPG